MDTSEFIKKHQHLSLPEISLKLSKASLSDKNFILQQINGLQKTKAKIPSFNKNHQILYPPKLNLEQSSSETTAIYKSTFVKNKVVADLTGGFGIDSYFLSRACLSLDYIEPNSSLFKLVKKNFTLLHANNITAHNTTAEEYLAKNKNSYDFLYLDPSRRKETKKVFRISDCSPDIGQMLPDIWTHTTSILVKFGPFLDISQAIKELQFHAKEVHVISINNECKELLFHLTKNHEQNPHIITVNFTKKLTQEFSFYKNQEISSLPSIGPISNYLYEPNSAILKAGAFNSIAKEFNLTKLHPNTHLYTSEIRIKDFPGRSFKTVLSGPYHKKTLKGIKEAAISTRNFPDTPTIIRKKFKLKESSSHFLFAITNYQSKPELILCNK